MNASGIRKNPNATGSCLNMGVPKPPNLQAEDVNPEEVRKYIVFHKTLNPKFWTNEGVMKPMVRLLLLRDAMAFYKFIDLTDLRVEDITVTGSNASYNYTPLSDLDVHLIVNFNSAPCAFMMENFFTTKKTLWNTIHDITVKGQPVEMYVQDRDGLLEANGVYSLLKNQWVVRPKAKRPAWDDMAVVAKTNHLADEIDGILARKSTLGQIDDLLGRIKIMRQSGLAAGGEFSTENLAFKSLRNLGYLDRLFKERKNLQDKHLSGSRSNPSS